MKKIILIPFLLILFNGILFSQNLRKKEILEQKSKLLNENQLKSQNDFFTLSQANQKNLTKSEDYGTTPSVNWIKQFGGSGEDIVKDIIIDTDGYIYITGYFTGKIKIVTNTYTSSGLYDAFVAKFSNNGNLIWLTQLHASSNESVISNAICLDGSNNVYVTGYYTGSVTFGSTNLSNNTTKNMFFAKINNSGSFLLAKNHGEENSQEEGLSVKTDISNNIYVLGASGEWIEQLHESIIIKYASNGNELWVQEHPECFSGMDVFNSSIYYSGTFSNGWGDGTLSATVKLDVHGFNEHAFIAKANSDGEFLWGKSANITDDYGINWGNLISIDTNEDAYLVGTFKGKIIWGEDTLTISSSFDGCNGFITKISSTGTIIWSRNLISKYPDDMSIDNSKNIYILQSYHTSYNNRITKFNSEGAEQFSWDLNSKINAIANFSDNLFTTGYRNEKIFISKKFTDSWTRQFDSDAGSAQIIGMVTDNLGNVYTYGNTTNTISYLGETFYKGIFICKQDPKGNLTWSKQFPDIQITESSMGDYINIDTISNYLYITGDFNTELKITDNISLNPLSSGSIFILKYDLDGNYIWSVQEDFNAYEPSVVPDHDGNIIFSGVFYNYSIAIGNTNLTGDGNGDGFIAKYNSNGNFLWAIRAGGEETEYSTMTSTDNNNNIYVSGEFISENITLGNSTFTLEEGKGNILFAKLNSDGKVLWHKSFGKSDIQWQDYRCWPSGIKTDAEGYTYLKGWMGDSTYFDNILLRNPDSDYGFFIAKIDPDGNIVWINPINKDGGMDYNQFDIDSEGSVYFGGSTYSTLKFGDDFTYTPAGKKDLFVAKYSTTGDLEWVKGMASTNTSDDWISSVAVYKSSNIYVGGYFNEYLSVDDNTLKSNSRHGFVSMLGEDITESSGFNEIYNKYDNELSFYPNPSSEFIHLNLKNEINGDIEIINLSGQVVQSEKITSKNQLIDLQNLNQGIYFIRVKNNSNINAEKLIIK